MASPRPLWRWWLFCVAYELDFRFGWQRANELWVWCILPAWVGWTEADAAAVAAEERPF